MTPLMIVDQPLPDFIFVCETGHLWHVTERTYCGGTARTRCGVKVGGLVVACSPIGLDPPSLARAKRIAMKHGYLVESTAPACKACFPQAASPRA